MQLAEYLKINGLSDEDFGRSVGVSRQAIHRYKTFDRYPEKKILTLIAEVTSGDVMPNDFIQIEAAETEKRGAA